nr:MAG TPA: hypothetical protein [Caudoviricetes sp.]
MENNFNNEEMMDNGTEALNKNLMHDVGNAIQKASTIIVVAAMGYKLAKFIKKKMKKAEEQEVVEVVEGEVIETEGK